MPPGSTRSVSATKYTNIDQLPLNNIIYAPTDLASFNKFLKKYPLLPDEKEVLIDRFVYDLSFEEITTERNFTSVGAAYYLYRNALNKIKREGIK